MHSVRAYKMIFAVLERRLIQLLIKWLQFFINNICCFINHFTNNLVIIFPAYSWVLAKRLLSGWLVSKSCRASHVCPHAAEGRQARVCAPCFARQDAGEAHQRLVYNTKEVCYTC